VARTSCRCDLDDRGDLPARSKPGRGIGPEGISRIHETGRRVVLADVSRASAAVVLSEQIATITEKLDALQQSIANTPNPAAKSR